MSIAQLLQRPIAFHRAFVDLGVGITGAVMLSQAFYWSGRTKDRDGWFYKTQEEWTEETGMTRYEQETARKKLREAGILEEKKKGIPSKLYYRINMEALEYSLHRCMRESRNLKSGDFTNSDAENQPCNTEITTETTTETEREPAREEATPEQLDNLFNPSTDDRRKFTMSFDWRPDGDRIKARMTQMAIPILPPAEYRQSLIAFQNHFEASGLRQTESQWIAKLMSWIQGDLRNKQAKALSQPVQPSYKPFPKDD